MPPKNSPGGSQRYPAPDYIWYRGRRRRVWGVEPTTHQGHCHYILRFKAAEAPEGAHTMAFGSRGQEGYLGVAVRADTVQPYTRPVERTGKPGRPRRVRR